MGYSHLDDPETHSCWVLDPNGVRIAMVPRGCDVAEWIAVALNCSYYDGVCAQAAEWLELFPDQHERVEGLRRVRKIRDIGPIAWAAYWAMGTAFLQAIYAIPKSLVEELRRENPAELTLVRGRGEDDVEDADAGDDTE